jgi:beta propeller repeat protein
LGNTTFNKVHKKRAFIRTCGITVIALMSLIGLISVVSAGQEARLTDVKPLVQCTSIFDNYVTWYDTAVNNVNVFDLTKGIMIDVPHDDAVSSNIPIYGSKIVWHDMGCNITMYDISTNEVTQISTSSLSPDIYGNKIVYVKLHGDDYNPYKEYTSVFLYDLTTNKETQITEYSTAEYTPVIYGNKIVWSISNENYKPNLYIYDIPTRQISSINTTGTVSSPDIYGNIIVWLESGNVYMRDISTHKTTQITNTGKASQPAIYGNRIVYVNSYSISDISVSNICMYDISTGKTTQITNCGCASSPSIYNDKIVYHDSHAYGINNYELGSIYLYDLSAKPVELTAAFTADKISGEAPLQVQFNDLSENATEWSWDFGDGNISTKQNPTHTYFSPGAYLVSLKVSNSNVTDSKSSNITVLSKSILPVLPGNINPPTNLNHDGLYEDVNGNGILDFDDIVAYYDNMDWIGVNAPVALFDYNKNGLIDFDDIVKLHDML